MMRVPCKIGDSSIHGQGVFATQDIKKGELVWVFSKIFDRIVPFHVRARAPKSEQERFVERCYMNPDYPDDLILCGDEAQFLNFPVPPEESNVELGGTVDGQDILVARRDIKAGEELTVPPESDGDYERKLAERQS
jgi:SET domain-containing protein